MQLSHKFTYETAALCRLERQVLYEQMLALGGQAGDMLALRRDHAAAARLVFRQRVGMPPVFGIWARPEARAVSVAAVRGPDNTLHSPGYWCSEFASRPVHGPLHMSTVASAQCG